MPRVIGAEDGQHEPEQRLHAAVQQPEEKAHDEGHRADGLTHVCFHARGDLRLKCGISGEAYLHALELALLRQPFLTHLRLDLSEPGIGGAVVCQSLSWRRDKQQAQCAVGAAEFIAHQTAHVSAAGVHQSQRTPGQAKRIVTRHRGVLQIQR